MSAKKTNTKKKKESKKVDEEKRKEIEEEETYNMAVSDEESEEKSGDESENEQEGSEEEASDDENEGDGDMEVDPSPITTNASNAPKKIISDGRYRNKQRCLVICSRGVTARYRHLLEDLRTLIPHQKKDSKLDASKNDTGGIGKAVNDICEMKGCSTYLFLECRKRGQDAYLVAGYAPNGPSVRFLVNNIHTMDELRLTGNCMKGSRPILNFDESFGRLPQLRLIKTLFTDIFGTPRGHPKSKPFVDRIMGFYYADGKIWIRNYQILEEQATNAKEAMALKKAEGGLDTSLVEIGPRFVLDPIRILSGSFWGQTLYLNKLYVSPNEQRSIRKRQKGGEYKNRIEQKSARLQRKEELVLPEDPLDSVFR